jgi:GNAT superfamily N-acetyltransferase
MFSIRPVTQDDQDFWLSIDHHSTKEDFHHKVNGSLGYVLFEGAVPIGLMHYHAMWDNLPFLNFMFLLPEWRGKRYGKAALAFWESTMQRKGYQMTLLSTQADESAQFFYRKQGYRECGCLILQDCPLEQPMEIFFLKVLTEPNTGKDPQAQ